MDSLVAMQSVHIKLFGKPTATYEYVKRLLKSRAEEAEVDLIIQEVQSLERILEEDVPAIPTIKVNNHFSFTLSSEQDVNEFINMVSESILQESDFGKMQKIIVATDFSESAQNAYLFAQKLAAQMRGVMKVIHVHEVLPGQTSGLNQFDRDLAELKRSELDHFVASANELWSKSTYTRPLVDKEVRSGNVVEQINAVCKSNPGCMVVVGSKALGAQSEPVLGSVATVLAKRCQAPLFMVPPGALPTLPERVAYAYDDPEIDQYVMPSLARFLAYVNAELFLVHAESADRLPDHGSELLDWWLQNHPEQRVMVHRLSSNGVVNSLSKHVADEKIELLAMGTKRRGFPREMFHKSMTKKMTSLLEVPLLILHRNY